MKTMVTLLLQSMLFFACSSEYTERVQNGTLLKTRIDQLNSSEKLTSQEIQELNSLKRDLIIQAKISGNEEVYFEDVSK